MRTPITMLSLTLSGAGCSRDRAETDRALRQATADRAAGGPAVKAPYDDLARQIGASAAGVTDEQVASVVQGDRKRKGRLRSHRGCGAGRGPPPLATGDQGIE